MEQKQFATYDRLEKILEELKRDNPREKSQSPKNTSGQITVKEKSVQTANLLTVPTNASLPKSSSDPYQPEPLSGNIQSEPIEHNYQPKSLSSQITTLYNRGINERSDRNLFWETFSITRIGNANAVAQRLGEVSAPDFREAGNGDFLAIKNDNQSYFVVPLFDTTITSSAFNEGGIGYAFECLNYDSQSARSIVRVNQPAIFRREGEQWFLIDDGKGKIILQN